MKKKIAQFVHNFLVGKPQFGMQIQDDHPNRTAIVIIDKRIPQSMANPVATLWYPGKLTQDAAKVMGDHLVRAAWDPHHDFAEVRYPFRSQYQEGAKNVEKYYDLLCKDLDTKFRVAFHVPRFDPKAYHHSRVVIRKFATTLPPGIIQTVSTSSPSTPEI